MEGAQIIAKQIIPMQMLVYRHPRIPTRPRTPRNGGRPGQSPCINFRSGSGWLCEWEFMVEQLRKFLPQANVTYNDPDLVLQAVLDGHGIAQTTAYLTCD